MAKLKLPQSLEAERSLLCCLFLAQEGNHQGILNEILNQDSNIFYLELHRRIFEVFKDLSLQGFYPDAVSLDYFINDTKLLMLSEGNILDYITTSILSMEPSAMSAPLHIKILIDLAKRRALLTRVLAHGEAYKSKRNDILAMLEDTSHELNEEEVLAFLYTIN